MTDEDDWDDSNEWDDDDYDEFLQREFPDSSSGPARSPAIWKWTAWILLATIVLIWVLAS